jgi:hypothetical protein
MAIRFRLIRSGMDDLLHSTPVERHLLERAEKVADRAKSLAPIKTGAYRNSIRASTEDHPGRVAAHVSSNVDYAATIEARLRVLGRSIDAARG